MSTALDDRLILKGGLELTLSNQANNPLKNGTCIYINETNGQICSKHATLGEFQVKSSPLDPNIQPPLEYENIFCLINRQVAPGSFTTATSYNTSTWITISAPPIYGTWYLLSGYNQFTFNKLTTAADSITIQYRGYYRFELQFFGNVIGNRPNLLQFGLSKNDTTPTVFINEFSAEYNNIDSPIICRSMFIIPCNKDDVIKSYVQVVNAAGGTLSSLKYYRITMTAIKI